MFVHLTGCTLFLLCLGPLGGAQPLRISVYAPAGTVNGYLANPEDRERSAALMHQLKVSKVFVEGRRGDQYVTPEVLRTVRDDLRSRGFEVAGGIATVAGKTFGVPDTSTRVFLNFQAEKTQREISQFFAEDAAIFDEVIVDDFYCTRDTSPESERARGARSWSDYRRDLLVSLIDTTMLKPARTVRPSFRLIIKYPQWYDRFHLLGYDPPRMSALSDITWVGTETRNPHTAEQGYTESTQGYVNFRWLSDVAGAKVEGAWFDHIDCTAQQFVDQAYQSVLAGARELTLFNLRDLEQGHPGDALLQSKLPELFELADKVRGLPVHGVAYYKPAGSDGEGDLYLMDYLAMIGLPIVPVANYPASFKAAILGAQAAADPDLVQQIRKHLASGATLVLTPSLLRLLQKSGGADLAGASVSPTTQPGTAAEAEIGGRKLGLDRPLEIEQSLQAPPSAVRLTAISEGRRIPLLTARKVGRGHVMVWNVRGLSDQDGREGWVDAPKEMGLPDIPQALADELRRQFLLPLGIKLDGPTQVAFYLLGGARVFYNFRDRPVELRLNGDLIRLGPNRLQWR